MTTDNISVMNNLPILYSLRNCPYAMRARIAVFKSKQPIELRDIVLSNKPDEMLLVSPKGTVPVLVLDKKVPTVIDESLDIMLWALKQSDPDDLLHNQQVNTGTNKLDEMLRLIAIFDQEFKTKLEAYRCAKRYHEDNITECRYACENHLKMIEERLNCHAFIMQSRASMVFTSALSQNPTMA